MILKIILGLVVLSVILRFFKVRVIYNDKLLDRLGILMQIGGIAIYPFIILRERYRYGDVVENHERIHMEQQRELWILPFYILYLYYYLKNLLVKRLDHNTAYRKIPFEVEAYNNQGDLSYIGSRKKFAWRKLV